MWSRRTKILLSSKKFKEFKSYLPVAGDKGQIFPLAKSHDLATLWLWPSLSYSKTIIFIQATIFSIAFIQQTQQQCHMNVLHIWRSHCGGRDSSKEKTNLSYKVIIYITFIFSFLDLPLYVPYDKLMQCYLAQKLVDDWLNSVLPQASHFLSVLHFEEALTHFPNLTININIITLTRPVYILSHSGSKCD